MIHLAVSGSRNHKDMNYILVQLKKHLTKDTIVFVGDCRGADEIVRNYCAKDKIPYQVFRADWSKYGKSAGPRRNKLMMSKADLLVAFPLGESVGTHNAMACAKEKGIPVFIYENV